MAPWHHKQRLNDPSHDGHNVPQRSLKALFECYSHRLVFEPLWGMLKDSEPVPELPPTAQENPREICRNNTFISYWTNVLSDSYCYEHEVYFRLHGMDVVWKVWVSSIKKTAIKSIHATLPGNTDANIPTVPLAIRTGVSGRSLVSHEGMMTAHFLCVVQEIVCVWRVFLGHLK